MATPIVIPNCVQVRLHWTTKGITYFNVMHAQYTLAGPVSPTAPESVFAALKASAGFTAMNAHFAPGTSLTAIGIRDLRNANQVELLSTSAGVLGADSSGWLPTQVAIVVTLRTALAGRAFRGRVYLGGLGNSANDANAAVIASGVGTAAVNFVAAVQSALAAQSMTLAIGQRALPQRQDHAGNTLPARPANVVPVTSLVMLNTRFDTQRRRLQ